MSELFRIVKDSLEAAPGTQILRSEDYAALMDAKQIIEHAQQEAARIREEAKEAFAAEKKRGYEEGVEEGKEKMSELMIESAEKSVQHFEKFENDLIDVVMQAIDKIIGGIDRDELTIKTVKKSLDLVRTQQKVRIIVAPDQVKMVREQVDSLLIDFPGIRFIEVEGDARVGSGGCKLESPMGVVDGSIDHQLQAVKRALTAALK